MKFVATKKGLTTNLFSPLSFVVVFGSKIQKEIRDPEWVKIRIRDKHLGSATLIYAMFYETKTNFSINKQKYGKIYILSQRVLLWALINNDYS